MNGLTPLTTEIAVVSDESTFLLNDTYRINIKSGNQ